MVKNDNEKNLKILFVSSVIPDKSGAVKRLLYDILCSNRDWNLGQIDIVFPYVEIKPDNIPKIYNFIPWSDILSRNKMMPNKRFRGLRVRRIWKKYAKIHINAMHYNVIISFPFETAAFDYVGFKGKLYALVIDSTSMIFSRAVIKHSNASIKAASVVRLMQNGWMDLFISHRADYIYLVGRTDAEAYNVFFNRSRNVFYVPHTVMPEIQNIKHILSLCQHKIKAGGIER